MHSVTIYIRFPVLVYGEVIILFAIFGRPFNGNLSLCVEYIIILFHRVDIILAPSCFLFSHSFLPCNRCIFDTESVMSVDFKDLVICSVLTA